MEKTLNVAIIGTGNTLVEHVDAWSTISDVTIMGILDTGNDKTPTLPGFTQMDCTNDLTESKVDVVDICVPIEKRADWIKQIVRTKLPIICDMKLGETIEETFAVMHICKEANIPCYPRNDFQFMPAFADAQTQVADGALGNPGVMRLAVQSIHPNRKANIFAMLGTELFAWLNETFGSVANVMTKHIQTKTKDGSLIEYAVLMLRMKSGAIVHIELSWAGKRESMSFELTGDKGMLQYDSLESTPIHIEKFTGTQNNVGTEMVLTTTILQRQLESVTKAVQTGILPKWPMYQVEAALEIAYAANESVKIGKPVPVKGDI